MNERLGREVTRAMRKAKLTSPALAKRAGVGESWVKQVRTGRIEKPRPEWLQRIEKELGLDPNSLLAMTDQLGASRVESNGATLPALDPYAIIQAHTKALEAQTTAINRLLDRLEGERRPLTPQELQAQTRIDEAVVAEFLREHPEVSTRLLGDTVPAGEPR